MKLHLTTHVLDTMRGCGAAGLEVSLHRISPEPATFKTATLDANGRGILLDSNEPAGFYELLFEAGNYFADTETFLDQIPVRFRIGQPGHYHIPLILSPFGYSTYRGS